MPEILITELPNEGHIKVYKITSIEKSYGLDSYNSIQIKSDVLGTLRVFKDQYIWTQDIFTKRKIGRRTAINYFRNFEKA